MFNWLRNYLNERTQYVYVNDTKSTTGRIVCGVPQGSVLGPLLFLIYVNDLHRAIPNDTPKLFADDTNVFTIGKDISEVENKANKCLSNLHKWCTINKLSINVEKTNYMIFGVLTKQVNGKNNVKLHLSNQIVERVSSTKYLGIFLEENLT